jgi:hypothetical protein
MEPPKKTQYLTCERKRPIMGECRNLLPVNRLREFRYWLANVGYETTDGRAPYESFGVLVFGKTYSIYVRDRTSAGGETVHASIYGPVVRLARSFLEETGV